MPVLTLKQLIAEIEAAGCIAQQQTVPNHYHVVTPTGEVIANFAAKHGRKGEIKPNYVSTVRKALKQYKGE